MCVRRVEPEGWRPLVELRLRALAEAPTAFGTTFPEAQARTTREWRDWAARLAGGVDAIGFVVDAGTELRGLVAGFAEAERVALVSMWVAPGARRRGLGSELVERVVAWAEDRGAAEVALWVNEENAALGLYERAGFAATGERNPLASTPGAIEIELVLPLPR